MITLSPPRPSVTDMSTVSPASPPGWRLAASRWRQRFTATVLLHSRAVIVDVETTDLTGRICEIAIFDTSGRPLLDTLVNPQVPISAEASAVHGITDADVADAPTWQQVAPAVLRAITGRTVIAYNAPFDQGIIRSELRRAGHDPRPAEGSWWCLMRARATIENRPWQALQGGHRAAGDCRAALAVLKSVSLRVPARR